MSKETYYNFPIHLLKGFLIDTDKCLNNIILYSVYSNSLNIEKGTELERVELTLKSFGLTGNVKEICKSAAKIYTSTPTKSAMSGINSKIMYDYRTNFKTDFDKVCLLAFLAIKSIIANKAYCKIDNNFLWSRMDGNSKSVDVSELSDEVKVYANRYQIDKIKKELIFNWYLVYYSRHTRGFYVSFKLDLEELVFEAEKKRKSVKEKQQKQAQNEALKKALERLKTAPT